MYKLVVFDLDGTLLNSAEDIAAAVNAALKAYDYPLRSVEEIIGMLGSGMYILIDRALPESVHKESKEYRDVLDYYDTYYKSNAMKLTRPYDGILELLDTLKQKGIKTGVLSNKPDEPTKMTVSHYLGDQFDSVWGHKEGYEVKPNPRSLLEIIKSFGFNKEEVAYVGDTNIDIGVAVAAGVTPIGVTWGFRTEQVLLDAGAEYIANTAEELLQLLLA